MKKFLESLFKVFIEPEILKGKVRIIKFNLSQNICIMKFLTNSKISIFWLKLSVIKKKLKIVISKNAPRDEAKMLHPIKLSKLFL